MTDPIPTPYRFPSMGHGACWSDNLAAIESDHGPVQPYTPPCTSTLRQVAPNLGDAPTPAETLELADQLDDYGGLDEKDAARFLREAVAARSPHPVPNPDYVTEVMHNAPPYLQPARDPARPRPRARLLDRLRRLAGR